MNLITKNCLLTIAFFSFSFQLFSQNDPDDYWLNNGFSNTETVYVNSGFFYDDGGNGLYQPGQDWSVRFCSENGNPITLDFSGFRTHYEGTGTGDDWKNYDYMRINYSASEPLVAYDTDTPQFSFTSPDGCITIGFFSQPEGTSEPDSGWVAEISTDPPPVNNDQCSATELTVGNVCSPSFYSNKGSWDTRGLGKPSCHEKFFGGDVWFKAVVPDSGKLKVETLPGSLNYGIMVLYRGACESLTEYECVDIPGTMPSRTFTGLTPGEVVYIRIFGDQAQSGTFGICATDPTAEITGFTGPGGVGDEISNKLWLKADTGVVDTNMEPVLTGNNVSYWLDKSGNNNHVKQDLIANQPVFNNNGLNSQPALSFNGNSTYMTDTLGIFAAPVHIFSVHDFSISKDHTVLSLGNATESNTLSIGREDISNNYYTYVNAKQYGQELLAGSQILFAKYGVNSPYHSYKVNGSLQIVNYTEGQVSTNGALFIGANKDLDTYHEGNISEIIFFSKVLNQAQEIIVNNYLAAKYNITVENNFYGFKDSHPNELAGIGRIDEWNSHSKAQSGGILSLGGASELEDNEFVLFAHDGMDVNSWIASEIPSGDPELLRIEREWRVDVTGNGPGLLTIGLDTTDLPLLPGGYNSYNILIDDDGDFSSGAEFYGLIPAGDELIANNVSLSDSSYISIAAVKAKINFSQAASSGLESEERPVIGVELNYAISEPLTVEYSVTSGTAVNGEDYSLGADILTFEAGERVKEIVPLIFEDTLAEIPNEYFVISLDNPGSGVLAGDTMDHTYTIIDNDLSLFITASDSSIGECDASNTTLTANATGQPPLSYSWSPIDGLDDPSAAVTIANPSTTTNYVVTVTDSLGGNIKDSIQIIVDPLPSQPVINVDGVTEFCEGESVQLTAPDGYSYMWNNGLTTQAIIADTSGSYTVTLIDEYGCESLPGDPVQVTVNPLPEKPEITVNGDTLLCEGESVELIAPAGYSYDWSNGSTSRSIIITESGEFSVRVIDANSCTSVPGDTVRVTVSAPPPDPVIDYADDNEICQGEDITLTGNEGYEYLWSTGETTRSITVGEEDIYTLQLINGACISSADSVSVIVHPVPDIPVITPSGPVDIIKGESVTLSSSEADQYLWSTSATTREIEVSTEGEYSVQAISNEGCFSEFSNPVEVTVTDVLPAPEISIDGQTSFCEGGSVTLSSEEAHAYRWSTGDTTREITVSEAGSYTLIIENENGVESYESAPVLIAVYDNPSVDSDISDVSCYNGSDGYINLTITEGEMPYSVEWSTGQEGTGLEDLTAGEYSATITDANGCQATVNTMVEEPDDIFIQGEITDARCPDATDGEIALDVSGGTSPYNYTWNDGMTGPVLSGLSAGIYTVTVSDGNNCTKSESFSIENKEEYCFRIPDIITPNGDGKNDTWVISGLEIYSMVTVQIFDRWGKRVFYSEGYDENFDGTYNGEDLPMESYHYIIDLNDGSPAIVGNITIVR